MSDTFDKLNKTFNVESDNTPPTEIVKNENGCVKRSDQATDVDDDYKYGRAQLYSLVEKGQEAIQGALEVAQNTDHPRAYEVAGNLIKNVAEVTEKLGDLQEKMKKLKDVPNNAPKNVTNALFVGSTAELQKMLKKKKDD